MLYSLPLAWLFVHRTDAIRPRTATIVLALALLASACSDTTSKDQCALSPNIVDLSSDASPIHDPTMIKAGKTYYLYSSSPLGSFYTSNDMIAWRFAGNVFDHMPAWLQSLIPAADHVGAPDISYYEGQYLLYYQSHIPNSCNAATGLATVLHLMMLKKMH